MKLPFPALPVLLAACTATLFSGCAPGPSSTPSAASASGLKEYTLEVQGQSQLRRSGSTGRVTPFPASGVSLSSDGAGTPTLVLQLKPAYGGHGDAITLGQVKGATQRLTPVTADGSGQVKVTSRKLAGLPVAALQSIYADIPTSGADMGRVTSLRLYVSGENLVECKKLKNGKFLTTLRQNGTTYTLTIDRLNGFDDGEGKSRHDNPTTWTGELGTVIYISDGMIEAERIPAGPSGPDFSHLETQNKRGEFD